ncbi:SDR family NAD(P)-dependent oxidoreductase [Bacillus sp. S14(2024)]|uniref:SDR family NAD(P)-dependent oxidoreductase n=1 Tax=Bacillus sp. S14(2024) TaxID=3162884 RepID=UPI003D1C8C25
MLAEADANVVVCSRRVEVFEEVVKEIEALGRKVLVLAWDVTDFESDVQGVDKAISLFRLDK